MPPTGEPDGGDLRGRRILIAGATGHVGRVVTRRLAGLGAELVLHGHADTPELKELAVGTRAAGTVTGDLTDPVSIERCREAAGRVLHGLVNCVTGFDGRPVAAEALGVTEFRRVVDVDLVAGFALVKALIPALSRAGRARVVLFSSLAGIRGRPGAAHLCAAKAGVQGLALGLARDLDPYGIGVHVVAPGPIGRHAGPTGVPFCTVDEVADVVTGLCRPSGAADSGAVLTVAGARR